jgi:hypothetical protein
MGGLTAGLHNTILPSASRHIPPVPRQQRTPAPMMWQQPPPPVNFTPIMMAMRLMMPRTPYHTINHMGPQFGPPPPQFGPPPPTFAAFAPPTPHPAPPAGMTMPYYHQYPQTLPFRRLGAGNICNDKINNDFIFTPTCPIPTHNYLFAALVLLKTISTDAATIKRWAILDSGATSHFLTTDAPALDICPTSKPIIAQLPNGKRVHSTHTCTLDIASLPRSARVAHIIPGLALHSLLSIVNMCNVGCEVNFTKKC